MILQRDMRRMCWLGESSGAIKSASDLIVTPRKVVVHEASLYDLPQSVR